MVFIPSRETFSLSQDRLPVQTFQQFYRLLCEQLHLASSQHSGRGQSTYQSASRSARSTRAALKATPPRWLSLALPLPDIDPLVALEQLGGMEQQHFYWEQPSAGLAIAAADPCASVQFHGPERFRRSQAFIENCIAATVVLPPLVSGVMTSAMTSAMTSTMTEEPGNADPRRSLEVSLRGPRFFCSFTFFDFARADSRFPPATLFLPSWQVIRQQTSSGQAQCSFVGHVTIQRGLPAQDDCLKLWQRYQRLLNDCPASFSGPFDSEPLASGSSNASNPSASSSTNTASVNASKTPAQTPAQIPAEPPQRVDLQSPEAQTFKSCVQSALQTIDQGELHKAVLARPQSFQLDQPISALAALNALRQRHPDCHIFSVGAGVGIKANSEIPSTFLGASPERLLRVQQRQLQTEAIAGSAPRGQTPEQDLDIAHQLQTNPKERHEHHLVSRFITETLRKLGLTPEFSQQPQVLKLSGIQHLQTPIRCPLPETIHPLEVLAQLHPTPAVAGVPQPLACEKIRQLETFERSLYASPIGWIDSQGNCDFCVGIRSALIEGDRAHLFAGAGIVKGSKPEQELQEVALKLQTLLSVLMDTANQA